MKTFNCIYSSKDYIEKRKTGENVVSAVALYGINALTRHKVSTNFTVLSVNMNDYSFFRYDVIEDRFRVLEGYKEFIPHTITEVISSDNLQNEKMLKWWNIVFYERDGKPSYDRFYDDLKVADDTDAIFSEVIKGFSSALSKIPASEFDNQVFLTGELAENPLLQYVLQNLISKEISVLHCFEEFNTYPENSMVILPKEKLERLKLNTNVGINLASIVSKQISITLALDTPKENNTSIKSFILPNIKWEDTIVDNNKDYSVNDIDFKSVKLHIECDPFQNIFLYCEDINGHRKVLLIN